MSTFELGTRFGPFEILDLLGEGGMGRVYRARDTRLHREVALKVLACREPDLTSNLALIAEAQIVSSLTHPNICTVHEVFTENGFTAIVMEYVDGETLEARLERKPLSIETALRYGEQLARALDAAHQAGIVHRDVKPSNIIVAKDTVKLLDFGIAAMREAAIARRDAVDTGTVTDAGSAPGTAAYMAPEQLEGSPADPRTDIFALGIVIYQMIAGRRPFDARSRVRTIAAILEHRPDPLTSDGKPVPPAVERVVMKCLEKDPRDRWQSPRDLAGELAWLSEASLTHEPHPPQRRWRAAVLAPVALLAVILAIIVATAASTPSARVEMPGPIRFLAATPPNSVVTVSAGSFAVSPDGRFLAFTASSGGGPRLLWVRSLDSFEAQPLSGTEEARIPFWSPDSRSIAFFVGKQLKTIGTDGRLLQLVASFPSTPTWGSWGSRGDILAVLHNVALYRVRASGETPELLLSKEHHPTLGFGGPEFLPDGEHFLLGVLEPDKPQNQVSIFVGSAEEPLARLLVRADTQAIYAAPGYILYMRAGSLVAHPFDPQSLAVSGEPVPVPEPAAALRTQLRASFSVSQTGVLVYRQGITTTVLTWFDRSGRRIGSVGAPGRHVNPTISPDGTRIAVTRLAPSLAESDIWLFEPRGERQLTASPGVEDYGVWSPDGRRIAYSFNATGAYGTYYDLFVKDAAASANEPGTPVLKDNRHKLLMDWTPDGKQILFLDFPGHVGPSSGAVVYPVLPPSTPRSHHSAAAETAPAGAFASVLSEHQTQVSPDGRWLAYVSDYAGSAQVYVRAFPEGQRSWQVSTDGGFEPKWRGDGRELFYVAADQQLMSVAMVTTPGAAPEIGRPTPLFRTTIIGAPFQAGVLRNEYAVTRDGERFLMTEPTEGTAAYALRVVVNWPGLLPAATR